MTLPDQRVEKGQTIDLTFHMDQLKQLEGLQFALAFPNLDLINRKESMLQQAHMGWQLKEQHLLPISWTQVGERKEDNKDFLRLTFQANKEGWLSDLISLQQELLSAEAYTIEQEQLGIKLIFEQDEAVFEVLQNRPNPFKESTTIGFHLPTDDRVSLSILSMDGKVVKEWTQPFEKGFNEWTIHRRDFNLTGLLHYQIATSQQVITRKMIVLE